MSKIYRIPHLSERLQTLADLVTVGNRVCDVGCDHGYVSIYLIAKNISPSVLAMDVVDGPLAGARSHVAEYEMEEYIQVRKSDGLDCYCIGEADSLIIAGMGGPLMLRILQADADKTETFKELILQPQSEIADFRKTIREMGYVIREEKMVLEDGKYYPMMRCEKGQADENDAETTYLNDCYGPVLLRERNEVLFQYLLREKRIISEILSQATVEKWVEQKKWNEKALALFGISQN